jgi:hypothetical protein
MTMLASQPMMPPMISEMIRSMRFSLVGCEGTAGEP